MLLGLDSSERESQFSNEEFGVDFHAGSVVSLAMGAKASDDKKAPYTVYNHDSHNSTTLAAFADAVALSNVRLPLVAVAGLAAAAIGAHYLYFIKFKQRSTAGQYLDSDECMTSLRGLRTGDHAYRSMIGRAPTVEQA